MIRRLNIDSDRELIEQAFEWEKDYPRWLRDAEKVNKYSLGQFIAQAHERVDIGIFAPEFIGMVSIILRGKNTFEGHIWAKRGSRVEVLASGVYSIIQGLRNDLGMTLGYVWIAKKNLPIKKLCIMATLVPDGLEMEDGESHGKPIKWIRCSC